MARIRKLAQTNYTVIDNKIIRDESLSWKAKGVFAYLWSMPDDWEFFETEVMTHAKDGRDSLRSAIKELQDHHYMRRTRTRNEKGQVKTSDWELSDKPMLENPTQGKPTQDNPMQENPTLPSTNKLSTDLPSTDETNDEEDGAKSNRKIIVKDWTDLWDAPNVVAQKALDGWLETFNPEMVRFAINVAGYYNVKPFGAVKYVQTVIDGWTKRHITTLEDAEQAAIEHDKKTKRSHHSKNGRKPRKELLPDWAKDSELTNVPTSKSEALSEADRKRLAERVANMETPKKRKEA